MKSLLPLFGCLHATFKKASEADWGFHMYIKETPRNGLLIVPWIIYTRYASTLAQFIRHPIKKLRSTLHPTSNVSQSTGRDICWRTWVELTFILLFHPLPSSAWVDRELAEVAEQEGMTVEHPKSKSTQPRISSRCPALYEAGWQVAVACVIHYIFLKSQLNEFQSWPWRCCRGLVRSCWPRCRSASTSTTWAGSWMPRCRGARCRHLIMFLQKIKSFQIN